MTDQPRKAGSLWKCGICKKPVITQPGNEMLGRPCSKPHCQGKLEYHNGVFVYEGSIEFKVISDYYLVGRYIRQDKSPLDRAKFHPKNRMSK
jgi:hypothetical protein